MFYKHSKNLEECDFCGELFCYNCSLVANFCSEACADAWDARKEKNEESDREKK